MADELEMLRIHVEAVWGVRLPALDAGDVTVALESVAPPWSLYMGTLASGLVRIWRRDVAAHERAGLVKRALAALAPPAETPNSEDAGREVALRRVEASQINVTLASRLARRLTIADTELLDEFEENSASYYLAPERAPVFGVVEQGRLVSVAHSSRRTAEACELGVETAPDARTRGYALAVTVLWAEAVAAEGIEPIYSALAENTASLALAHAAGYRPFVRSVHLRSARPPARGEITPRR